MTIVNDWELVIVDIKLSILDALGILDSPLCEILEKNYQPIKFK